MENNKPLFSIIVACYNVEKYIRKCITSILQQDFHNYELIIVDDGSTDGTEEIIRKLQTENEFVYLKKQNGGLSSVRNYGLKYARGTYIIQFDGDDFVDQNWLTHISDVALNENPDIIFWGGNSVNEEGHSLVNGVKKTYDKGKLSSRECLYYLGQDKVKNWSWGFAFKKYILSKIDGILYPEKISYEDLASTYKIVIEANKICFINGSPYHYTQHQGTITKSPSLRQYKDLELIKSQMLIAFKDDFELSKLWMFQLTIMQYQIVSRIENINKKKLLNNCTNIIINNKSKFLTKAQLVKFYLVKLRIYCRLYPTLYNYRNK